MMKARWAVRQAAGPAHITATGGGYAAPIRIGRLDRTAVKVSRPAFGSASQLSLALEVPAPIRVVGKLKGEFLGSCCLHRNLLRVAPTVREGRRWRR
jgi:hypothetical protein